MPLELPDVFANRRIWRFDEGGRQEVQDGRQNDGHKHDHDDHDDDDQGGVAPLRRRGRWIIARWIERWPVSSWSGRGNRVTRSGCRARGWSAQSLRSALPFEYHLRSATDRAEAPVMNQP